VISENVRAFFYSAVRPGACQGLKPAVAAVVKLVISISEVVCVTFPSLIREHAKARRPTAHSSTGRNNTSACTGVRRTSTKETIKMSP